MVLTGVHIGDYLDEKYRSQAGPEVLLKEILKRTSLPRLRVSSLEPVEISEELIEIYQDPRMCPHFHMSIQSACTKTLVAMKRQYTAKEVETSLKGIYQRIPGVFVGMDVIAGFPGETKEDFLESFHRLESLPWTRIHVFPYSERPGTYAARLSDRLPRSEVISRAKQLRELSSERYAREALAQIGQIKQVLTLAGGGEQGLSRDYWPVQIEGPLNPPGQELSVRILGYDHSDQGRMEGCLRGQVEIDAQHENAV